MNTFDLAKSYLEKATKRLKILPVLSNEAAYSDVVREAQEIVELSLKGMLRAIGIDPPKYHDVSDILLENKERFSAEVRNNLDELAQASKLLRKERELAFYGDIDFIPTEEYKKKDAEEAIKQANFAVSIAQKVMQ